MADIIERAQHAANRRYPRAWYPTSNPVFIEGATFAATITPDQVEAMARDLYLEEANDSDGFDAWPEWESHDNPTRDIWRFRVNSMLRAAGFEVAE